MPIFKVVTRAREERTSEDVRLIKAENAKAVRGHLLADFEISEAEAEDAHSLGEQGVKIEQAAE